MYRTGGLNGWSDVLSAITNAVPRVVSAIRGPNINTGSYTPTTYPTTTYPIYDANGNLRYPQEQDNSGTLVLLGLGVAAVVLMSKRR